MSVSVRVTGLLADRRFSICVDRPTFEPWIIDLDSARRLHRDLGEALEAIQQLRPEGGQ